MKLESFIGMHHLLFTVFLSIWMMHTKKKEDLCMFFPLYKFISYSYYIFNKRSCSLIGKLHVSPIVADRSYGRAGKGRGDICFYFWDRWSTIFVRLLSLFLCDFVFTYHNLVLNTFRSDVDVRKFTRNYYWPFYIC